MKSIICILLIINSFLCLAQDTIPKVAIVFGLDSISDYIITNPMDKESIEIGDKYLFNVKNYIINQFQNDYLKGYKVIEIYLPDTLAKRGVLNLVGKPTEKYSLWLTQLKNEYNIEYVVMLGRLILHPNQTQYNMLNSTLSGEETGIITYYGNHKRVVVYSMVDYLLLNTSKNALIKYDPKIASHNFWRKIIKTEQPITSRGLIIDEFIPTIEKELTGLFDNHILSLSYLISQQ